MFLSQNKWFEEAKSIVPTQGGMRFFKNGCNGGMESFARKEGEARNGRGLVGFVMGGGGFGNFKIFKVSLAFY